LKHVKIAIPKLLKHVNPKSGHEGASFLKPSDHGRGVPEEQLRQLTRPFFRVDESRNVCAGSGLGLAIVEAAVQRMGGGFGLSTAESGGLCAQIRLRRA
jgi:two-component system osmolarity sensor histidine kinase EnvZ